MTFIQTVAPSMSDVMRGITTAHHRALEAQTAISVQLELEQPSDLIDRGEDDGLDAFGRLIHHAGIVTRSNPAAGVHATPIGRILNGEHVMPDGTKIGREAGRAIGMIWAERQWRRAKYGMSPNTRGLFTSDQDAIGEALRPYVDNNGFRELSDLSPTLPLSAIIAQETSIDGASFRSVYVDETAVGTFDYTRVTEAADIPTVDLRTHENTIRMHKRGRAINWSYEAARNIRLDKFGLIIAKMALDVEAGKAGSALATLFSGDVNPQTAPITDAMTDMDSSLTAGDPISLRAYLRFKKQFRGAFKMNTIIANIEDIVDLELTEIGLDSTPLVAASGSGSSIGGLTPLRDNTIGDDVAYADVEEGVIPAGAYLGFDRRFALERISQIGASISEADNFISNQTSLLTFTDVDGFGILYPAATRVLDTTA